MTYKDKTILEFIEETGSSHPTPGGGSVAALIGATSAALVAMLANLTIGKIGYDTVEIEMIKIARDANHLSHQFLDLIDEDCNSFTKFMEALRLPKGTEEEKEIRHKAMQEAYQGAAEVPYKIGLLSNQIFDLAETVIEKGNKNAITDGLMGVLTARCAIRSAFLNVKINLVGMDDENYVKMLKNKMTMIEAGLEAREKKLLGLVEL